MFYIKEFFDKIIRVTLYYLLYFLLLSCILYYKLLVLLKIPHQGDAFASHLMSVAIIFR